MLARTAAYGRFPQRLRTAGVVKGFPTPARWAPARRARLSTRAGIGQPLTDCDRRQTSPASLSGALRRGYAARRTARRYAVAAGRGRLGHEWSGTTLSPGEATIALSPGCNTTGTHVCARAAPSPPARRSRPTTPCSSCATQTAGRPQMKGIIRGKFNTLISLQPEFRRVAGLKPTSAIHPPTASGR